MYKQKRKLTRRCLERFQKREDFVPVKVVKVTEARPLTEEEQVKTLRKSGLTLKKICEVTGLSYAKVQKYAKEV